MSKPNALRQMCYTCDSEQGDLDNRWRGNVKNTHNIQSNPAVSWLACMVLAMVIAGCGNGAGGGGFSMPPTPVETAIAETRGIADRFSAVGTLEAVDAVTIVSEIDGAVLSIPYREGEYLSRGSLIAQMDTSQLAAEMSRAEALLAQRRTSYERIQAVVAANAAAPQDLDDAAAILKVAEADLALARARYAKTRITAPFGGMVGSRQISPGAYLRAGQAITELANIDQLRVKFSAPERYLGKLVRGTAVTVTTTAFPDVEQTGQVEVVEPTLDSITRNARVVARVVNPGRRFRPGMSADVSAVLSNRPEALSIPNEAVFVSGDQSFVFVVNPDSTVVRTALTLGTRLTDVVEVLNGLKPGDRVVRAGHQKLFDGARVMPVSSQQGS